MQKKKCFFVPGHPHRHKNSEKKNLNSMYRGHMDLKKNQNSMYPGIGIYAGWAESVAIFSSAIENPTVSKVAFLTELLLYLNSHKIFWDFMREAFTAKSFQVVLPGDLSLTLNP